MQKSVFTGFIPAKFLMHMAIYKSTRSSDEWEYSFEDREAVEDFYRMDFGKRLHVIEEKISKRQAAQIKTLFELDYSTMARLGGFHERTIYMKSEDALFTHPISNEIIALVDLYAYGYMHVCRYQDFNRWMKSMNPALFLRSPLQLVHHYIGRTLIKEVFDDYRQANSEHEIFKNRGDEAIQNLGLSRKKDHGGS